MTDATPNTIEDLALGAFRLVKTALAFELDFTAETLPVLDHYLLALGDAEGGPDEAEVALVGPCAGAYFGEVLRRTLPGLRWHLPNPEEYPTWRIEGEHQFVCFNPVGAALEAIHRTALPGWHAHLTLRPEDREPVERALAASGPVRDDDFHRLAVRHEVMEQVLVVLATEHPPNGSAATVSSESYSALLEAEG